MKTVDDFKSKGAWNDGTQSNDRISNFLRAACEKDAAYEKRDDANFFIGEDYYRAQEAYYKAALEFDKFGERGQATNDFSKK